MHHSAAALISDIFLPTVTRGINANVPTTVIPEPGPVALLIAGAALLFPRRYREALRQTM